MIRRLLATAALAFALLASPSIAAQHTPKPVAATSLAEFTTEAAAQQHCPSDTVVWLNTKSGIYHEKGMRW